MHPHISFAARVLALYYINLTNFANIFPARGRQAPRFLPSQLHPPLTMRVNLRRRLCSAAGFLGLLPGEQQRILVVNEPFEALAFV